jgi:enediyne biosynthesis protein CalE3
MDQRLLLMHQAMLADRPRLAAYDRAIEAAVRPGDVVADAGAGTLVLSLLALHHGAEHVYAVEADPEMADVAGRIIRANDLTGRITLVEGDARVARLPAKADVVVSEMMGNLGPEERMQQVLDAFCRRNLKSGGIRVPRSLATRLAAVEFDGEGWGVWGEDFHGFRFDVVEEQAQPEAQLHFFQRPPRVLAGPVADDAGRMTVTTAGTLHAVAGFFTADLADGVELTNFPSYPGCNWAVWIWPLRHTRVEPGDELETTLRQPGKTRERVVTDWRLDCRLRRGVGRPDAA